MLAWPTTGARQHVSWFGCHPTPRGQRLPTCSRASRRQGVPGTRLVRANARWSPPSAMRLVASARARGQGNGCAVTAIDDRDSHVLADIERRGDLDDARGRCEVGCA